MYVKILLNLNGDKNCKTIYYKLKTFVKRIKSILLACYYRPPKFIYFIFIYSLFIVDYNRILTLSRTCAN